MRDYGIELLNLGNYNGSFLADSNYVGLQEWRLLYASLYSSQIIPKTQKTSFINVVPKTASLRAKHFLRQKKKSRGGGSTQKDLSP
jgi:hypothetical protein